MKKFCFLMALLMLVPILCACGAQPAATQEPTAPAEATVEETAEQTAAAPEEPAAAEPAVEAESTAEPEPEPEPEPETEPEAAEPHWYDEHIANMKVQSDALYIPADESFLSEPQSKTILGSKGYCIYELFEPKSESEHIGKARNGNVVSVLAREGDYALFVTEDGLYAWGTNGMIVDKNDKPYRVDGKHGSGTAMIMSHNNDVYVMYDPYCIFPRMGTIEPNTQVTAYRTVNGFTYVETDTLKGWVNARFLS